MTCESEPEPPQSLRADDYCCRTCGSYVPPLFYDDMVKKCSSPGRHTIGWNGQLTFEFMKRRST